MLEYDLLLLLSKRENYERFSKYAKGLTKEVQLLVKEMGGYFASTGVDEIEWNKFSTWFTVARHPTMDLTDKEIYVTLLDNLDTRSSTPPSSLEEEEDTSNLALVRSFVDRSTCEELAYLATKVADGDAKVSITDVKSLLERRDAEVGELAVTKRATWGEGALTSTSGRLRWRLTELNKAIGALGEDLLVVGSRPDGGKTTFLASECTHMATQLDEGEVIKWYANEEALSKIQWRIIQAALGWKQNEMEEDWTHTWAEYKRMIGGDMNRIDLVDCSGWTAKMIEADLKASEGKVALIVIDQLRKVHAFTNKDGNEATRLELLYQWARDQAKLIAPVLTVHQADGTSEGMQWITMDRLHGSKTGVQGEADAVITIGQDPSTPDSRYIYVPKNKLRGDDPTLRNGKFEVYIDKERARFLSP
jgi:hypothetical protein